MKLKAIGGNIPVWDFSETQLTNLELRGSDAMEHIVVAPGTYTVSTGGSSDPDYVDSLQVKTDQGLTVTATANGSPASGLSGSGLTYSGFGIFKGGTGNDVYYLGTGLFASGGGGSDSFVLQAKNESDYWGMSFQNTTTYDNSVFIGSPGAGNKLSGIDLREYSLEWDGMVRAAGITNTGHYIEMQQEASSDAMYLRFYTNAGDHDNPERGSFVTAAYMYGLWSNFEINVGYDLIPDAIDMRVMYGPQAYYWNPSPDPQERMSDAASVNYAEFGRGDLTTPPDAFEIESSGDGIFAFDVNPDRSALAGIAVGGNSDGYVDWGGDPLTELTSLMQGSSPSSVDDAISDGAFGSLNKFPVGNIAPDDFRYL